MERLLTPTALALNESFAKNESSMPVYLNLSKKVFGGRPSTHEEKASFNFLEDVLDTLRHYPLEQRERVMVLDLSFAQMLEEDLGTLEALLELLPNVSVLNMSNIEVRTKRILPLVRRKNLRFVIVTSTMLASFAGRKVFVPEVMSEEEAGKLIFLHADKMFEPVETSFVHEALLPAIERGHRRFFSEAYGLHIPEDQHLHRHAQGAGHGAAGRKHPHCGV